ncbi:MAG: GGDEF and EAL domain-containing protein [Alphaproteobacteria bacterium]|nr:GGDEF and EAL domain-containing protein [Alphaproteobacteria bacterium]MDE1985988.1 GGDEF and EAL domain-containing protein [Alphaproteobacteria bacterium]MDE2163862.1 GGDEF and EAL domain-containing protein [Alphaproteobacteria bacterium]MDE2500367.1 GGDEF and EAL domain-containing protein [Alphaproteobacteria bacterium]
MWWWTVLNPTLQKKPVEHVDALRNARDVEHVQLALTGAGIVGFNWTLAGDEIVWDGACEILPHQVVAGKTHYGRALLSLMSLEGRNKLSAILESRARENISFDIDVELATALGSVWFVMLGVRIADADGATERLAGVMREITERKRENQRLTYLATRDELTGHLNRNSLRAELSEAIESAKHEDRNCAFLVASIDRLAMINDSYGFDAADEVIVAVGERLSRTLRSTDVIGRTAGNKFGVILKSCSDREITVVADRLRAAVRDKLIDTRAGKVTATSSVGAVCLPSGAATSQEAMLRAEEALERARSHGRDSFHMYQGSPQREGARLRLMAVADEVLAALKEKRLVFAYQPIIGARSRKTEAYECLLRMVREDGSIAVASQFIPAAEQLGLVRLVDRHALEMTVAQLHAHKDVTLSVNVSGTTSCDGAWLQSFVDYVGANAAIADRLIVELTETAALNHFEENAQFVSQLREMGCRVAIDDFGAGYTSFRNLQMLRVDMVKIDGAYVVGLTNSPENQTFVRTLVDLAKSFNLKTTAEWVGSEEDARLLESFGVDHFQGFHFGKPVLDPDWLK